MLRRPVPGGERAAGADDPGLSETPIRS